MLKHTYAEILAKFWSHIEYSATGCWLWTGKYTNFGYGQIWAHTTVLTHRFSYELHHGPLLPGFFVLHRCDVPRYVNPAHLFIGTQGDNIRDAQRKKRLATGDRNGARVHPETLPRGERHHAHRKPGYNAKKLTPELVRAIRAMEGTMSARAIGRHFDITHGNVLAVIKRRAWKRID